MKVLVAAPVVPWPLVNGRAQRTWHLLREASKSCEIHLRAGVQPELEEDAARASLGAFCRTLEFLPRAKPGLLARFSRTELERVLEQDSTSGAFDLVHLDDPSLVRALPASQRERAFVHHHALELELEHVTRHIVSSNEDAERLRARHPLWRTWAIPSGVDLEHMQPLDPFPIREPERFLFVGTLSSATNLDGLRWFRDEVLPRVRSRNAGAWIDVIGSDGGAAVRALATKQLAISGRVGDVRAAYDRAAAAVAPLRLGSGSHVKIVEALALACPLVSTRAGAQGLDLVHGEHLFLADSADAFAAALLEIQAKPDEARAMAARGRARVLERYGWQTLGRELVQAWRAGL